MAARLSRSRRASSWSSRASVRTVRMADSDSCTTDARALSCCLTSRAACLMRRVRRDTTRIEQRRHRERQQREAPVEIQHDRDHARERQHVHGRAQQRRREELLRGVHVAREAHHQIAGAAAVEERQRLLLQVVIERAAQVVHHTLADGGGERLLGVGAGGTDGGNRHHRERGGVHDAERVQTEQRPACDRGRQRRAADDVIDDELDRPGFPEARRALDHHRREGDRQQAAVRTHESPEAGGSRDHEPPCDSVTQVDDAGSCTAAIEPGTIATPSSCLYDGAHASMVRSHHLAAREVGHVPQSAGAGPPIARIRTGGGQRQSSTAWRWQTRTRTSPRVPASFAPVTRREPPYTRRRAIGR